MKLEYKHCHTYDETLFYEIYIIYLRHNYYTEKSAIQVYISPSLLITAIDNTKQASE